MDILLYPYLPLTNRRTVGGWQVIPIAEVESDDLVNDFAGRAVEGLGRLYEVEGMQLPLGAVARPPDGAIGDDFELSAMRTLGRALLVGLLDTNPDFLAKGEEPLGNLGHGTVTSDNALGYGHPVQPDGGVAVEYGYMSRKLVGGLSIDDDHHKIHEPIELPTPMLSKDFEGYYADAAHRTLDRDTEESRRLGRAIDWLGIAWRNSESLRIDMRIVALRTSFEVLLGAEVGELKELRLLLSQLLDPDDAKRTSRTWPGGKGKPITGDLTELEWWFTQFSLLRNAIVHGDELEEDRYEFEGKSQLWLGEARLREAITEVIAEAGFPDVKLDYGLRVIREAFRSSGLNPDTGEPLEGDDG